MNLQEFHAAFYSVMNTSKIGCEYYKPFPPLPFRCIHPVRLMDIGYKNSAYGEIASDCIDNSLRQRPGVSRWGGIQYVLHGEMPSNA